MLYQIVLKKGIDLVSVDQAKMKQLFRGATYSDLIRIQLKTSKKGTSLRYPKIIKAVREEEIMLETNRITADSLTGVVGFS